jgi:hypothetical protein
MYVLVFLGPDLGDRLSFIADGVYLAQGAREISLFVYLGGSITKAL